MLQFFDTVILPSVDQCNKLSVNIWIGQNTFILQWSPYISIW